MSEIQDQMVKIKRECHKLSEMLGYDRIEIRYNKEKRFKDIGILDVHRIDHCYSS